MAGVDNLPLVDERLIGWPDLVVQYKEAELNERRIGIALSVSRTVYPWDGEIRTCQFESFYGSVTVSVTPQLNHKELRFRCTWVGGNFLKCKACTHRYRRNDNPLTVAVLVERDYATGRPVCGHRSAQPCAPVRNM